MWCLLLATAVVAALGQSSNTTTTTPTSAATTAPANGTLPSTIFVQTFGAYQVPIIFAVAVFVYLAILVVGFIV